MFGSIRLVSFSAIFSFTSPVASSKPYEALTGSETHFFLARTSTRTLGGSNPNRLDSLWLPAIWTEKNRVVSFAVPGVSVHWMPVGGPTSFGRRVHHDHGDDQLLGRQPAVEVGPRPALRLEAGEGPRGGDVEVAVDSQRGQRGPQVRRLRRAADAHPDPAMQVFGLAAGGLDLHVLADLVGEQVAVVGGQDDRLDAVVGQHPDAPPQVVQHAVHLEPGLGDVVGLAEFVDLLRGDQDQIGRSGCRP